MCVSSKPILWNWIEPIQASEQSKEWGDSFSGEAELIWQGVWGRAPVRPRKLLRFRVYSAKKFSLLLQIGGFLHIANI